MVGARARAHKLPVGVDDKETAIRKKKYLTTRRLLTNSCLRARVC